MKLRVGQRMMRGIRRLRLLMGVVWIRGQEKGAGQRRARKRNAEGIGRRLVGKGECLIALPNLNDLGLYDSCLCDSVASRHK